MESKREEELKNLAEKLKKIPYSEFVEVVKNLTEEEILLVSILYLFVFVWENLHISFLYYRMEQQLLF